MVPCSRPGATGQSHTGNAADWEDSFAEPNPRHFTQSLLRRCLCLGTASSNDLAGRRPARETSERDAPRRRCRVFIRDHHVGYIDWATYKENQRMIRRNSVNWEGDESMTAIRAGQGLLVGFLRCGP